MLPLPTDPGWRATVEATIARLEGQETQYAQLALAGWYAELRSIEISERYWGTR